MTIKINGLDRVMARLDSMENSQQWGKTPMTQSLALLHDDIAKYKPKAAGAFSEMATPKQKRAYWARVRSGVISHGKNGYIRTNTLGRKWTTKISNTVYGLRGEVGNDASYARYVQSEKQQQPFHRATGFATDEQVIAANKRKLDDIWQRAIFELTR